MFFKKFGCRIFFGVGLNVKHGCPMYQCLSPHKIHSIMLAHAKHVELSNPASTSSDLSQDLMQDLSQDYTSDTPPKIETSLTLPRNPKHPIH